ncbi:hypothetical protein [Agriterribacter sp.]|uniref:hypothetical protein n=1 Tax=Agriterribacter sp. TaxID=2821509 RepID=UPI002D1FA157|nr:hypothetical protein [Agriterribacter sp.]
MKNLPLIIAIIFASSAWAQKKLPERDTVPVVILASDTPYVKMAITLKGFSVRERYNQNQESNGDWYCHNCKDYMRHSYYLDYNKQPLRKSFIIWQSVPAKQ